MTDHDERMRQATPPQAARPGTADDTRTLTTAQHPDSPARGTNEAAERRNAAKAAAGTRNAPERGGGPQLPGLTRRDPVGR